MFNKLQVALEELDTLEQPQDALVTNESELEVAAVVEEIQEEADELETTEELIEELEKQEAALENVIQGLRAVQNPTEDTVRLASVALENVIARIPEMHGTAAIVNHDAIRTGVAVEALATSDPAAVLAVALEEADAAKKTIMERIKAFFKWLGDKIKHFFKLVTDSVYRLESALKKMEVPNDYVSATIKHKGAVTLAGGTATVTGVIASVGETASFIKDYTGSYAAKRASALAKFNKDEDAVKAELEAADAAFGEKTISAGRKVKMEKGVVTIGKAADYSGEGEITVSKAELGEVISSAKKLIIGIQELRKNAGVLEANAKKATEEFKRDTKDVSAKFSVLTRVTNSGLMSVSKLVSLAAGDVKVLVSLANAAIKHGGAKKDDK